MGELISIAEWKLENAPDNCFCECGSSWYQDIGLAGSMNCDSCDDCGVYYPVELTYTYDEEGHD